MYLQRLRVEDSREYSIDSITDLESVQESIKVIILFILFVTKNLIRRSLY